MQCGVRCALFVVLLAWLVVAVVTVVAAASKLVCHHAPRRAATGSLYSGVRLYFNVKRPPGKPPGIDIYMNSKKGPSGGRLVPKSDTAGFQKPSEVQGCPSRSRLGRQEAQKCRFADASDEDMNFADGSSEHISFYRQFK